jgi:hypothetical protein
MTIDKVGNWYFVCILNQCKGGWGLTIKEALQNALNA